jgi:hypothetical protein
MTQGGGDTIIETNLECNLQTSVSAVVRSCLAISFVICGFKLALSRTTDCCLIELPTLKLIALKPLTTAVNDVRTKIRANIEVESIIFAKGLFSTDDFLEEAAPVKLYDMSYFLLICHQLESLWLH